MSPILFVLVGNILPLGRRVWVRVRPEGMRLVLKNRLHVSGERRGGGGSVKKTQPPPRSGSRVCTEAYFRGTNLPFLSIKWTPFFDFSLHHFGPPRVRTWCFLCVT